MLMKFLLVLTILLTQAPFTCIAVDPEEDRARTPATFTRKLSTFFQSLYRRSRSDRGGPEEPRRTRSRMREERPRSSFEYEDPFMEILSAGYFSMSPMTFAPLFTVAHGRVQISSSPRLPEPIPAPPVSNERVDRNLLGKSCPICLDEDQKDLCISKRCQHLYCTDCILQWMAVKKSCPICRSILSREMLHRNKL